MIRILAASMILKMQWIIRATSIIEDELDRLNRPEVALSPF